MSNSLFQTILSIVIVSAMLIVILSVRHLGERAKSVAFIVEINEITKKTKLFVDKYDFYPGDFPFAQAYFSIKLDGNGDSLIADDSESLFAWKHLELAGFMALKFDSFSAKYASVNNNMVASGFSKCAYQLLADKKLNNINYIFSKTQNFLRVAKGKSSGNLSHSCFTTEQAELVDRKIDDAMPLSGRIYADSGYENWHSKKKLCICKSDESVSYCNLRNTPVCFIQIVIS